MVLALVLLNGCIKKMDTEPLYKRSLPVAGTCISTYEQLVERLGTNVVEVQAVMLESGVAIRKDGLVKQMVYEATPVIEYNSLFRSILIVTCDAQVNRGDYWSLGCVYADGGSRYTNIILKGQAIFINTKFYWAFAPYTGEGIDWIILD